MTKQHWQIKPYPLGAHCEVDRIRFSFMSEKKDCGILLYNRKTGRLMRKLAFEPQERMGHVYCKYLPLKELPGSMLPSNLAYQFYEEDRTVPDTHGRIFTGGAHYGRERSQRDMRAGFLEEDFDWGEDRNPCIPYEDCICYCAHVRGFTRHPSSKVSCRGTFLGMVEKLDYLKESGITTVELQPAYEFLELPSKEERLAGLSLEEGKKDAGSAADSRLNYWGYKKGFYYAPKAGYPFGEDASVEFKQMVKAFHHKEMEVVMQFYFPEGMDVPEIMDIVRFWVQEYHVDGFHLIGGQVPADLIAKDPALADTKLWYDDFQVNEIYGSGKYPDYVNLAVYRDDYLYTMRRYLKGDEDMLNSVLYQMRNNPDKTGRIHYMTNYYGMTLHDMVSYDWKHNEANGEENRDGTDYNCSWNCGEEGTARRKKIRELRMKQMKNAMCMLLFTQSTPLIFMGDEFGNSQKGNNNPYCQDNAITWLNWDDMEKNKELYEFWKELISLRKAHPILHRDKEMRIMDYLACGYPDLSYHGDNAWRPQTERHHRHIGLMYCGKYVMTEEQEEDDFFYVAMNMHWEPHVLGLPRLPKHLRWKKIMETAGAQEVQKGDAGLIAARSIAVYQSVPDRNEGAGKAPGKEKPVPVYKDRTIF